MAKTWMPVEKWGEQASYRMKDGKPRRYINTEIRGRSITMTANYGSSMACLLPPNMAVCEQVDAPPTLELTPELVAALKKMVRGYDMMMSGEFRINLNADLTRLANSVELVRAALAAAGGESDGK